MFEYDSDDDYQADLNQSTITKYNDDEDEENKDDFQQQTFLNQQNEYNSGFAHSPNPDNENNLKNEEYTFQENSLLQNNQNGQIINNQQNNYHRTLKNTLQLDKGNTQQQQFKNESKQIQNVSSQPQSSGKLTQNIGDLVSLDEKINEYHNPDIRKLLFEMKKFFPSFRKIRGDGNCFFRAFAFAFFQYAIENFSDQYYQDLKMDIQNTDFGLVRKNPYNIDKKKNLEFLDLIWNNRQENVGSQLQYFMNQHDELDFLIVCYIKLTSYQYFKDNIDDYVVFMLDGQQNEVEQVYLDWQQEAEGIPIRTTALRFQVVLCIHEQDRDKYNCQTFNDEILQKLEPGVQPKEIHLFFRPGHYDLFTKENDQKYSTNTIQNQKLQSINNEQQQKQNIQSQLFEQEKQIKQEQQKNLPDKEVEKIEIINKCDNSQNSEQHQNQIQNQNIYGEIKSQNTQESPPLKNIQKEGFQQSPISKQHSIEHEQTHQQFDHQTQSQISKQTKEQDKQYNSQNNNSTLYNQTYNQKNIQESPEKQSTIQNDLLQNHDKNKNDQEFKIKQNLTNYKLQDLQNDQKEQEKIEKKQKQCKQCQIKDVYDDKQYCIDCICSKCGENLKYYLQSECENCIREYEQKQKNYSSNQYDKTQSRTSQRQISQKYDNQQNKTIIQENRKQDQLQTHQIKSDKCKKCFKRNFSDNQYCRHCICKNCKNNPKSLGNKYYCSDCVCKNCNDYYKQDKQQFCSFCLCDLCKVNKRNYNRMCEDCCCQKCKYNKKERGKDFCYSCICRNCNKSPIQSNQIKFCLDCNCKNCNKEQIYFEGSDKYCKYCLCNNCKRNIKYGHKNVCQECYQCVTCKIFEKQYNKQECKFCIKKRQLIII